MNKIIKIISKVINFDQKKINIESNSNQIKNWDSFANVKIIIAMERELKIKVKSKDYPNLNSIKGLIKIFENN